MCSLYEYVWNCGGGGGVTMSFSSVLTKISVVYNADYDPCYRNVILRLRYRRNSKDFAAPRL